MSTILNDIFKWAGQQPAGNQISVIAAMTANDRGSNNSLDMSNTNFVIYAEGILQYIPAKKAVPEVPPLFGGSFYGTLYQFFSNKRYGSYQFANSSTPQSAPFDPTKAVLLHLTITQRFAAQMVLLGGGGAAPAGFPVTIKSSNLNGEFDANADAQTAILTGVVGTSYFITISLCGLSSQIPPPVPH